MFDCLIDVHIAVHVLVDVDVLVLVDVGIPIGVVIGVVIGVGVAVGGAHASPIGQGRWGDERDSDQADDQKVKPLLHRCVVRFHGVIFEVDD